LLILGGKITILNLGQ